MDRENKPAGSDNVLGGLAMLVAIGWPVFVGWRDIAEEIELAMQDLTEFRRLRQGGYIHPCGVIVCHDFHTSFFVGVRAQGMEGAYLEKLCEQIQEEGREDWLLAAYYLGRLYVRAQRSWIQDSCETTGAFTIDFGAPRLSFLSGREKGVSVVASLGIQRLSSDRFFALLSPEIERGVLESLRGVLRIKRVKWQEPWLLRGYGIVLSSV